MLLMVPESSQVEGVLFRVMAATPTVMRGGSEEAFARAARDQDVDGMAAYRSVHAVAPEGKS